MPGFDQISIVCFAPALGAAGCSDDDLLADLSSEVGRQNPSVESIGTEGGDEEWGAAELIELQINALSHHLD